MWDHYKKTFVGMQSVIAVIAVAVFVMTHSIVAAALFFVTMQIGSIVGAMWAWRLKNKLANHLAQPRRL